MKKAPQNDTIILFPFEYVGNKFKTYQKVVLDRAATLMLITDL